MVGKIVVINIVLFFLSSLSFSQEKEVDTLLFKKGSFKIYKLKASYNNQEIYNVSKQLEKLRIAEEGLPVNYIYTYNPLSLVDLYYSYERREFGSMGGGPPGSYVSVETINLKTMKPIEITELITEESLTNALKSDNWVRGINVFGGTHLRNKKDSSYYRAYLSKLDSCVSLACVMKIIERRNRGVFRKDITKRFAFVAYDKKKNLIATRLVMTKEMGFSNYKHLQLGLWLKPNRKFRRLLKKKKSNFYIDRFDNGLVIK